MTGKELAAQLGTIGDSLGIVEGFARAMKESVLREVADDHFSDDFYARFDTALEEIREALDECYDAIDDLPTGGNKPLVDEG